MGSEVRIEGLETLDYLDNLKNRERFTEQGDAITFESEVNICFRWNSFCCLVYILLLQLHNYFILVCLFDTKGGQSLPKHSDKNRNHRP